MSEREEFETLFLILYKKWKEWDKQTCAYGVGWGIWQEQQKIIDTLKAPNPDVDCPECGGKKGHLQQKRYPDDNSGVVDFYGNPVNEWNPCDTCKGEGTVPLTKAQEYRIKELEGQIKAM